MDFKNFKRDDWLKFIGSLLVLLSVWYFVPNHPSNTSKPSPARIDQSRQANQSTSSSSTTQNLSAFNGQNFEVLPKEEKIPVTFVRKVDGDTVVLSLNGREFRVRYLMIDTPESVKEGIPSQPYGKEASDRNEALLKAAKQVYLQFDKGPYTDDYQRALAYVYADQELVSLQLLKEGLAAVSYVNPPNNSQEKLLRQAQKEAKNANRGIWSIPNYVNEKGKFTIQE